MSLQQIEPLEQFIDKLIADKNFQHQDPVILSEIKKDLMEQVEFHINASLLAALPKTSLPDLDEVLARQDAEEIQKFLRRHIADFETVIAETLLTFKTTYLGV